MPPLDQNCNHESKLILMGWRDDELSRSLVLCCSGMNNDCIGDARVGCGGSGLDIDRSIVGGIDGGGGDIRNGSAPEERSIWSCLKVYSLCWMCICSNCHTRAFSPTCKVISPLASEVSCLVSTCKIGPWAMYQIELVVTRTMDNYFLADWNS